MTTADHVWQAPSLDGKRRIIRRDPGRRCFHCDKPLDETRRRHSRYCNAVCKKRAWRRRHAGLAEDRYVNAGARGRVSLKTLTRAEKKSRAA